MIEGVQIKEMEAKSRMEAGWVLKRIIGFRIKPGFSLEEQCGLTEYVLKEKIYWFKTGRILWLILI